MPIQLEMRTDDPEERQLAVRYWAMSESGEFVEKVMDLVPFRDILHGGSLAAHVREWCCAYDENLTCRDCGASLEVKSRSMAKKFPQTSSRPCPACKQVHEQREREARARAAAELDLQIDAYIRQLPSGPIDYSRLSDDQALLLLALNVARSPRSSSTAFSSHDCTALAPMDIDSFMLKLQAQGIIREDPHQAMPGTYFLQNGELMIHTRAVTYTLAPDVHLGTGEEALSILVQRNYSDTAALFDLWLDFACADAMRYLIDKCTAFDHDLDEQQLGEIRNTLREALKTHSVSQVWFVIWKNVKDAASLARLVYYSEARATATLPGKIRRTFEKVDKQDVVIRKWDRPDHQPSGTLGMLFTELFGIDEDTPGIEVLERLTMLQPDAADAECQLPKSEQVRRWLCDALVNDNGPQMLQRFAALIREGHEIDAAISQLLGATP